MSFARAGLKTLRSLPRTQVYQATSLIAARRNLSTEARKLIEDVSPLVDVEPPNNSGLSFAFDPVKTSTDVYTCQAVTENPLVLFMKGSPEAPQCGFSRAVVQILDVNGVEREKIKAFNCLADQELREGIKEFSDWPTIPQVYIKGEFVGGADIMFSMHQSGELEKLLVKEGLIPELPPLPEDEK